MKIQNSSEIKHFDIDIFLHFAIVTVFNTFLRWTYFGQTRSIHPWTTLVYATLCVSDVTHKWNSWLADVTFDWCHVIEKAVECNNQKRQLITFLCRLFCNNINKIFTNGCKTNCKYKRWISFFWGSSKYKRNLSRAKFTWRPLGVTYFAHDPSSSYFDEPQENEKYFLNISILKHIFKSISSQIHYFQMLWLIRSICFCLTGTMSQLSFLQPYFHVWRDHEFMFYRMFRCSWTASMSVWWHRCHCYSLNSRNMRYHFIQFNDKICLCHMRTTKTQISLCSMISDFVIRFLGSIKICNQNLETSLFPLLNRPACVSPGCKPPKKGLFMKWVY